MAQKKKFSKELTKKHEIAKQERFYKIYSELKECDAWEKGYKKEIIIVIRKLKELSPNIKPFPGEDILSYVVRDTEIKTYIRIAQKFIDNPKKFLDVAEKYLTNIKKGGKE